MPIPRPHLGEQKQAFISRCISMLQITESDRFENEQIQAICFDAWREFSD